MRRIPLIVRATFNATGAVTFTGNTLGLSRSDTAGVPGTQDSIGAFVTTNTASAYGTYPSGTTSLYTSNSSSAILNLPVGSTVLYAELIWGGTYINGTVNLSAAINNPVAFTTPAGSSSVTPDSATANQVDLGNGASAYVRSANVTSLVQAGMGGTYTAAGVVGTIVIPGDSTANHAGWTLGVIYQNPALPFRNMSIRAGAVLVQATSSAVNTTLTGFATPISGTLGGRALFSAQEGDANRTGDQALFGPTASSLVALSGPNNFANNFFASQINNDAGQLDTTGTFGNRNQTNGAPGTNIIGGRQGWDITNVDISARLTNNQSSAVLSLTTSGDAYVVNGNAIQVDINAPKISVVKSANASGVVLGDTITYTVTVSNSGTANAASIVVSDALPTGLTFVSGSVAVAGAAKPTFDITAGASLGSLNLGSSITLTYRATVTSVPSPQQVTNVANAAFTFQSVAGGSIISGVIPSNGVTLPVYAPLLSIVKSASTANATVGNLVTYTLLVGNSGNIAALTTITDNIPTGSSFVTGSFRVNGVVVANANPAAGVPIGSVAAGATSTVTFQVRVDTLPSPPQLVDQASAAYTFQPPDGRTVSGSAVSNTVRLPVSLPAITVVKSASLAEAAVGETLTYTAVVTNNGTEAVSSVVLSDTLPSGAAFVSGSVTVAGQSRPTAIPGSGISIGTIAAGSSVSVAFQALIGSLPSSPQLINQASVSYSSGTFTGVSLSNTVSTSVYQAVIEIVKSADRTSATVGSTITYTLVVRSTGNIAAQPAITDNIPAGSSFVPGSVTVNGAVQPAASPVTGIPLGSLAPGASATVTFQTVLNSLPSPPFLLDQGTAAYTYQLPGGRALSGSSQSNTLSIPASSPNVSLIKGADRTAATVNDIVTYTLVATNNGVDPVTSVNVADPIPSGASFVTGSVTIRGAPVPSATPDAGIPVGTIGPQASVTIQFQIRVTALPASAQLSNRASAAYQSGTFNGSALSNTVVTPVYVPAVSLVKSASVANATVGDTFNYTIIVTNSGNIDADVTVTDPIPPGASFNANSVLIGGTPTPGVSPSTGIPVGTVSPGASVAVSFVVTINTLPASQRLVNAATASYGYRLPDGRTFTGTAASDAVTVNVSAPNVSVVKTASPASAVTGDTVTYTVTVKNNGIGNVNNVVVSDILSSNVSFITGSVQVNGSSRPNSDPSAGIPIGTLPPGGMAAVTFEVSVTMPIPSSITNQSTVSFTSGTFSSSSSSNTTTTPVIQPQINLVKSASTSNATLGDAIIYTVVVSNTGNLAGDVTLFDTIPAGTLFSPNSVNVGGSPLAGASPTTGIHVGPVAPGASVTVTFEVVVVSLPSPPQLSNQASATYTFTPPDGRPLSGTAVSNTVTFPVSAPNVSVSKSTLSTAVSVGDTVTYSTVIGNAGIEPINNVLFIDPVPQGASFVPGTVTINGIAAPSAVPASGIAIGTIAPSGTVTVAFNVAVNSVPASAILNNQASVSFTSGAFSGTTYSNAVQTPVYQPSLAVAKTASSGNATVGDTISYTLTITNSGNYPADATLTDPLPGGTVLVPNSVMVNNFPQPGADPSTGIHVGTIGAGASATVMFSVVINTVPTPQQLSNQGTAAYTFTLPDGRTKTGSAASNTVVIPVSAPNVNVVKSSPSTAATVGDTITYTTAVTNSGIESINNVVFNDALPAGVTFVAGSVSVDGTLRPTANPASGVSLGSISPGSTVNVSFNVRVTTFPPAPSILNNQSTVSFTSGSFSGVAISNMVAIPVYQPILSAVKSSNAANATVGDTIVYTVVLTNSGNYGANVTLTDTIPDGTTLVPNSVLINGFPAAGADPATGIPIGTVTGTTTVAFSVVINTLPANQQIVNQASAAYTFTLPDGRTLNGSVVSNIVTIPVSSPNIAVIKSTATQVVAVGETVTYSINITNNGLTTLTNVLFSDPIPDGSTFNAGSVTVGVVPRPSANPANGIPIGTLAPGESVTVTFSVTVTSLPSTGQLSNRSQVSFTSGAFSSASFSNTLVTPVYQPIIGVVKSANTANATVGDTIIYALNVTNTGNWAADVILFDNIPTGAVFVPNSVIVNGTPQPGTDPASGIDIGIVQPGITVNVKVTLQVTVDALPSPQQLVNQATANFTYTLSDGFVRSGSVQSNSLVIPVSAPNVSVVKSTNAVDAVVGDIITYTIVVTNSGIETVNSVVLVDPVPAGTRFVAGSVTVDGSSRPSANPNNGIPIGSIAAGGFSSVTFQVQVVAI
ncbi:isopeptide-forming domain-containing fimbrial protein [Paenibacillus hodogayensis]|uniref:Isopeptide-forming domain-containing fimbrial protein n=1 Tax=Paenibacillus hodogayensis TaxID=279208 RepID=A0ABV5W239_9BACL